MSTPKATAQGLYQSQCIRNPRLDDVAYTDLAPIDKAKVRLRRAYVVAGVLFGVSLLTAVVPAIYVASTMTTRSPVSGTDGKWTVCWPCRGSSTGMCCSLLADTDFQCNTITARSNETAYCWPDDSYHLVLDDGGKTTCSDDTTSQQLRGWRRPSWWSSKSTSPHSDPLDRVVVRAPGVYVIYSKILFGCSSHDVDSDFYSYVHKIFAMDGKGGKSTSIVESQRGRSSHSRSPVCYSSFLAVMAELHSNDSVYVKVKPCSIVQRSPGVTQFGVYRIR